jgi:hypothetical protein
VSDLEDMMQVLWEGRDDRWLAANPREQSVIDLENLIAAGYRQTTGQEFRVLPKVFGWRDKVRLYQDEQHYNNYGAKIRGENRHEVRDVTEWRPVDGQDA